MILLLIIFIIIILNEKVYSINYGNFLILADLHIVGYWMLNFLRAAPTFAPIQNMTRPAVKIF